MNFCRHGFSGTSCIPFLYLLVIQHEKSIKVPKAKEISSTHALVALSVHYMLFLKVLSCGLAAITPASLHHYF